MLLKLGVDISRLKRKIRTALGPIEHIFIENGNEAIITSTYEGNHMPSSLHYYNNAVDINGRYRLDYKERAKKIKQELGNDYDVIPERDHIHIEYDPKGKEKNETI